MDSSWARKSHAHRAIHLVKDNSFPQAVNVQEIKR